MCETDTARGSLRLLISIARKRSSLNDLLYEGEIFMKKKYRSFIICTLAIMMVCSSSIASFAVDFSSDNTSQPGTEQVSTATNSDGQLIKSTDFDDISVEHSLPVFEIAPRTAVDISTLHAGDVNQSVNYLYEMTTKASSPQSALWNFGSGSYSGGITQYVSGSVYTNYSFQPNANGELWFDANFERAYTTQCTVRVECYYSDGTYATYYDYPTNFTSGSSTNIRFYNLNISKACYFKLICKPSSGTSNSFGGSFYVRNSK